jgi:hypothetical protein
MQGKMPQDTRGDRDMSNRVSSALAQKVDLDEDIESLTKWLGENGLENSGYGDQVASERLAWHYGYLIALRDVRDRLAAA